MDCKLSIPDNSFTSQLCKVLCNFVTTLTLIVRQLIDVKSVLHYNIIVLPIL